MTCNKNKQLFLLGPCLAPLKPGLNRRRLRLLGEVLGERPAEALRHGRL